MPVTKPLNENPFAFNGFGDDQWLEIAKQLPASAAMDAASSRRNIEVLMMLYVHDPAELDWFRSRLHPDLAHLARRPNPASTAVLGEGEYYYRVAVPDVEISRDYARQAAAARKFIDFFDPGLTATPYDDHGDLLDRLTSIAEYAETRSAFFKAKNGTKKKRDGQRVADRTSLLVSGLIGVWKLAGGNVGGAKGGPLSRFIASVARVAMKDQPSDDQIRHWIRDYKKLNH